MDSFIYHNGVKVYLGKGVARDLGLEVRKVSESALLVLGGGSCKKNGSYDEVRKSLTEHSIRFEELEGVSANPTLEKVNQGIFLCRKNNLRAVICLGGGSVIDCGKLISAGVNYSGDVWNFLTGKDGIENALPIFTILTIAASGSEADDSAVLTNEKTKEKRDCSSPLLIPSVSFLDPTYTYSVKPYLTACGVVDMMSHVMEQYFSSLTPSSLQDNFAVAIFKTCLKEGLRALHHPSDYEARANLMWASSWCEEGVIACGHNYAWVVHPLEHPLSGHFNVTHGAGLSVLTPVYFSYILNRKNAKRFAAFGEEVFSLSKEDNDPYKIKEAEKFIECLKDLFFNSFSLPSSLKDLKVDPHLFKKMAQEALDGKKTIGDFVPLKEEDIVAIYKKAYR